MKKYLFHFQFLLPLLMVSLFSNAQYQMENLDRGVVAMNRGNNNYITWRMFGTEPLSVSFNVYRDGNKITNTPITNSTNYVDNGGNTSSTYSVSAIINGVEGTPSSPVSTWGSFYKELSLNRPAGGTTPAGENYDYSPNDATVADLDGDGQYEIIFKWTPSNAHDNAHDGYTGPTYIEALKLDGTSMWRINLGRNIRSGAHYVELQAYDFDGDGKAEVALRTADGTVDGQGKVIGNANADYRTSAGRVLSGPEFLSMFNGETGAEMSTVNYVPARGSVSSWGDGYGNRVDRFLSGVVYLNGQTPSLLMCRGYYTRMVVAAWDFVNGQLVQRWVFDTNNGLGHLEGKGNHQISVADVDNDGKQEVIYGAVIIDDNGGILNYNSWWHGDALHCGDFDLNNPGLEIFEPTETGSANPSDGRPGFVMRDAASGNILWAVYRDGDIGRGNCANIDSRYPGAECWASGGAGLYNAQGQVIGNTPSGCNFSIWWDGDLTRELLDGTKLDNWDENWDNGAGGNSRLFTIYNTAGASSINGTKSNPNLSADIIGDWREEMIYRSNDNTKLIIFTTNIETNHKLFTLMHDPQYRMAIAWQSTGYNQPPHPSFYIGEDMSNPPTPNIELVGASRIDCNGVENGTAYTDDCGRCVGGTTGQTACILDCNGVENGTASIDECGVCSGGNTGITACSGALQGEDFCDANGIIESSNVGFVGNGYLNYDNASGNSASWYLVSNGSQNAILGIRYANGGSTARPLNVYINGSQQATLSGNTTGDWTTWTTENISVSLNDGVNMISMTATSVDGGPNLDQITFTSENVTVGGCDADCNGVLGGSAFMDDCGDCVGGNTGMLACVQDCNGEWGGTAILDNCGICAGGNTSFTACSGSLEAEDACAVDGILLEDINEGYSGAGYVNTTNANGAFVSWIVNSTSNQTATFTFKFANGGTTSRDGQLTINGNTGPIVNLPSSGSWTTWQMVTVNVDLNQGSNEILLEAVTADGLANLDMIYFSEGVSNSQCIITSLNEYNDNKSLKIYPNPTRDKVNWKTEQVWILLNALGQEVGKGKGNEANLSSLPNGMYFLKIGNDMFEVIKH